MDFQLYELHRVHYQLPCQNMLQEGEKGQNVSGNTPNPSLSNKGEEICRAELDSAPRQLRP